MSNSFNIITRNYSKTLRKFQSQSVFRNIRKMCSSTEESRIIYKKAEEYWSQVSQDVNSMLGGFESLHQPDIIASKNFINHLKKKNLFLSKEYALDCGAGIGRVTKHLLMPIFEKVDLVDVTKDLIEQSDNYIGPTNKVKEKFVEGLQTFDPPKNRYDLIWIQWVSGYLIDEDFIQFFQRCAKSLKPGGCIVLKDNIIKTNKKAVFDNEDNSWTRTEKELITLFEKANLDIASKSLQAGFPKDMYPVKMFALKPKTDLCE